MNSKELFERDARLLKSRQPEALLEDDELWEDDMLEEEQGWEVAFEHGVKEAEEEYFG